MTTARDIRHPPALIALKLATARAVEAAGGQVLVARETGRSQGRVSDWCNIATPDFIPLDAATIVDALGAGSPGHPHIARVMARAAEAVGAAAPRPMAAHVPVIAAEMADLLRSLTARPNGGPVSVADLRHILIEADEAADAVCRLINDLTADV